MNTEPHATNSYNAWLFRPIPDAKLDDNETMQQAMETLGSLSSDQRDALIVVYGSFVAHIRAVADIRHNAAKGRLPSWRDPQLAQITGNLEVIDAGKRYMDQALREPQAPSNE